MCVHELGCGWFGSLCLGWGVEERGHRDFLTLRTMRSLGSLLTSLLSDTGGKEVATLIVSDQFLDYL